MRFDKKDIGMFSDEDPSKKKKKKVKITETQYQRLFKEKEITEQDEGGESSDSGGGSSSGGSTKKWEDMGRQPARGKANPITNSSKWESGVSRGVGNSWV